MPTWTEDRLRRLTTLWRQGHTAASIAREFGADVSRSAVLGKVHRLKLSHGRPAIPSAAAPAIRPGPSASLDGKTPRRPRPSGVVPQPPAPETRPAGSRSILTVRRTECRWPFGDPRDTGFSLCGCPVARGAFCAPHAARAYRATPVSAASLMKLADIA